MMVKHVSVLPLTHIVSRQQLLKETTTRGGKTDFQFTIVKDRIVQHLLRDSQHVMVKQLFILPLEILISYQQLLRNLQNSMVKQISFYL